MTAAIEVRDLTKRYDELLAVDRITFRVERDPRRPRSAPRERSR